MLFNKALGPLIQSFFLFVNCFACSCVFFCLANQRVKEAKINKPLCIYCSYEKNISCPYRTR